MGNIQIEIDNTPEKDDINYIKQELENYNRQFAQEYNHQSLTVFIKEDNKIIGGLSGGTFWNWLYIEILWINNNYRRKGLGAKLLKMTEKEAIKRGCKYSHLNTHDFQGLDFYLKHDYEIVSELKDLPMGHSRFLLKKRLN